MAIGVQLLEFPMIHLCIPKLLDTTTTVPDIPLATVTNGSVATSLCPATSRKDRKVTGTAPVEGRHPTRFY